MNSFQIMKRYPTAFTSFINFDLLKDFMMLGTNDEVTLKYASNFNVEYVGEIGERWKERKGLIRDNKDLLALTVALNSTNVKNVLYNQRERFCIQAVNHLLTKKHYDFVVAATVLSYGISPFLNINNSQIAFVELFNKLREDEESIRKLTTVEIAFVLHHFVSAKNDLRSADNDSDHFKEILEGLKQLTFTLVDQLIGKGLGFEQSVTPFYDVPVIEMLANVYSVFEKPKAKEFKTKGVVRYLQCFESLMYKEMDLERAIGTSALLNVNLRNIYIYNYELSNLRNGDDSINSNITTPGKQRIVQNFVEYGFLHPKKLEEEYKKRLKKFKNDNLIANLYEKIDRFKNDENLKLLLDDFGSGVILKNISKQHILLMKKNLLTDHEKHKVCVHLLEGKSVSYIQSTNIHLTEDEFIYLFDTMEKLVVMDKETYYYPKITENFITACLDYGQLTVNDTAKITSLDAQSQVAKYLLLKKQDLAGLLEFLENFSVVYHEILIVDKNQITELLVNCSKEVIQRYYEMYIESLFNHHPQFYADEIYRLQQKDELFKSTFELTVEEITIVEKTLLSSKLVNKQYLAELYEKHTSEETKELNRVKKLKEKLEESKTISQLRNFYENYYKYLKQYKVLSDLFLLCFIKRVEEERDLDSYSFGRLLTIFYSMKATQILTMDQIEKIETTLVMKYRESESEIIKELSVLQ